MAAIMLTSCGIGDQSTPAKAVLAFLDAHEKHDLDDDMNKMVNGILASGDSLYGT